MIDDRSHALADHHDVLDHVPIEELLLFDRICDQFESFVQRGLFPRLEDFLGKSHQEEFRDRLLKELLPLEIEYRFRHKDTDGVDSLAKRFPQHAKLVHICIRNQRVQQATNQLLNRPVLRRSTTLIPRNPADLIRKRTMIHVIATIRLKPGTRDQFLAEFRQLVPLVRAEAGCVEYGPAVDTQTDISAQQEKGADSVTVIEKWESLAALKAHLEAPHMADYRKKVADIVEATELHILEPA